MAEEKMSMRMFFKENVEQEKSMFYPASERIKDENGEPVLWELKILGYDALQKLRKRCTKIVPNRVTGKGEQSFDSERFSLEMTLQSVAFPDLNDADLQDNWGAMGAEALLKTMLTPGEITNLEQAVLSACGFESDLADKIQKVKN